MAVTPDIVVCGDSFCTSTRDSRAHFSQVLEDRYHYRVTNLARGSMSATGVCFQIQQAINLQPRAIVYAKVDPARLDIPLNSGFHASAGLRNFIYHVPQDTATGSDLVGGVDAPIFSQNISTLADLTDESIHSFLPQPVDSEIRQAVKMYVAYLYQGELKQVTESWMYAHWHRVMLDHGIVPLKFAPDTFADVAYEFGLANPRWPTPYHTDDATQEILAQRIHDILQKSH